MTTNARSLIMPVYSASAVGCSTWLNARAIRSSASGKEEGGVRVPVAYS